MQGQNHFKFGFRKFSEEQNRLYFEGILGAVASYD